MDLGARIMEKLEYTEVFSIPLPESVSGISWIAPFLNKDNAIPVTETVVTMWAVSALLIIFSIIVTRNLKRIPAGIQAILEAAVEFLDNFSKAQFGKYSPVLGHYIGSLFLFLLVANIIPALTPIAIPWFGGFEPLFDIKPPTRDINLTACLALISITLVLALGIHARGIKGWLKNLFHPVGFMVVFNLMDYVTRPLSLCLRLFGNILGGFVLMTLIQIIIPVIIPVPLSLYFDLFDGLIQAVVFCFLTTLYINEAVTLE